MNEQIKQDIPLAESFGVEFLIAHYEKNISAMQEMGGFKYRNSGPVGVSKDKIYFEGEREDGTTVRIEITKGDKYKTPAELATDTATKEK